MSEAGHSESCSIWEPGSTVCNCQDVITQFLRDVHARALEIAEQKHTIMGVSYAEALRVEAAKLGIAEGEWIK